MSRFQYFLFLIFIISIGSIGLLVLKTKFNSKISQLDTRIDSTASPETSKIILTKSKFDLYNRNPNEHILKYVDTPFDYAYGSNAIPLTISALMTEGDMLELGMGTFSTAILNKIAIAHNRKLVSVDTDLNWVQKFATYNNSRNHLILYLPSSKDMSNYGLNNDWGLVLVDHINAAIRPLDAINFANKSQIVIVHDAEAPNEFLYKYEFFNIRSYFKYVCKFSLYKDVDKKSYISTLILSNFIDVSKFKYIFDKINTDYGHVSCNIDF